MNRNSFVGVAVYPKQIQPGTPALVGVWLRKDITSVQRKKIMDLNADYAPGHIGVRNSPRGTAVLYIARLNDQQAARVLLESLAQSVRAIVGARSILRQLPNYLAVSRALAI